MISFCYTEDGNYSVQNIPDVTQSIIFDKSRQLVRLFNSENFYFSVLSDVFQTDLDSPHTGFSQTGAYQMFAALNSSIDARRLAIEESIDDINSSIAIIDASVNHIEDNYVEVVDYDSDSYDLAFSDEAGYVLVKFYGGHVATKNFDSSDIVSNVNALNSSFDTLNNYVHTSVTRLDSSVSSIEDTVSDYVDLREQVYTNRDNIEVLQQDVLDLSAWLVEDELIWSNVYIHFNSSILMANASINRLEQGSRTPIVSQTATTVEIDPNVLNRWSSSINALTVTFATPDDPDVVNEYMLEFTSNTTSFALSMPNGIKWANYPPQIDELATYQISVINNLGVCVKYS